MKIINKNTTSEKEFRLFYSAVKDSLYLYPFYQYKHYPSLESDGWIELLLNDIEMSFKNENCYFFYSELSLKPCFICYNINPWDRECFAVKMAKTVLTYSTPNESPKILTCLVDAVNKALKLMGVEFITARINGDNIAFINAHLANKFEYMETIVWPVLDVKNIIAVPSEVEVSELLTDIKELKTVQEIARNHQYQRSHFHCDKRFENTRVNEMCARWVETSFYSNDLIYVFRAKDIIIGFFICGIDNRLNKYLGTKYGRLKFLALDSKERGKGYGTKLFQSTLRHLANDGCTYIDSGYATKNHMSAYLHASNNFYSKYEEITLHCNICEPR